MHRGYIKFWRCSQDNVLYFSEPFTKWQAWQDLVLLANHTNRLVSFRGIMVKVNRGQVAAGEEWLSERWKWSRGKLRRFLLFLETEQQIVQQKTKVIGIVTILNYQLYQSDGTTDSTTDEQQTAQQTDTPKNVKKGKHVKKPYSDEFELFWKSYPNKTGKGGAYKAWSRIKSRPSASELIKALSIQKQSEQWNKDAGRFIPHPATWLNQARWDDELPLVGSTQGEEVDCVY